MSLPLASPATSIGAASFSLGEPAEGVDDDALLVALRRGDEREVHRLVASDHAVNQRSRVPPHMTALHMASSLASPACLTELLLPREKPRFVVDDNGNTALHCACMHTRSIASVLLLVSIYGAHPGRDYIKGNTFFHNLMENRYISPADLSELVKWLLERDDFAADALLNIVNFQGETPYDVAVRVHRGDVDLLQALLDNGADSGAMLRSNQIFALTMEESTMRSEILAKEEEAWQRVLSQFQRYSRKIEKAARKLHAALGSEAQGRQRLTDKELQSWTRLRQRGQRECTKIELRREKQRRRAVLLLQRIGRGYLARIHTAKVAQATPMLTPPTSRSSEGAEESADTSSALVLERAPSKAEHSATEQTETDINDLAPMRDSSSPAYTDATIAALPREKTSVAEVTSTSFSGDGVGQPSGAGNLEGGVNGRGTPVLTGLAAAAPSVLNAIEGRPQTGKSKSTHSPQKVVLTPLEREMGSRIWRAYTHFKGRRQAWAATVLQSWFRGHFMRTNYLGVRLAAVTLQRAWRQHLWQQRLRRRSAADMIVSAMRSFALAKQSQQFIAQATAARQRERIRGITQAVTQLVWRENFCSAFREIVFREKRQKPPPPPPDLRRQRWWALTSKLEPYILLVQVCISLFLLIYMGCIPRTEATRVHNKVDIAFICVEFVLTCLYPLCWWHTMDFAIIITALVCAAAEAYGGVIVITLLLLKIPLLVRAWAPKHSGTRTYCRAVRYSVLYMIAVGPFALAGIGATVRGACLNDKLLTDYGNWGRVFLALWSSLSPQYAFQAVATKGEVPYTDSSFPVFNVAAETRWYHVQLPTVNATSPDGFVDLLDLRMPIVQTVFFNVAVFLYTWAAIVVGTHSAIRSHYDISDETKLMTNKHRFRNVSKMELLDAHRATNMEALGQQLDGVMWEADVRAAKEAVDASHYDHNENNTVHRFVRRVQDSVAQGNLKLEDRSRRLGSGSKSRTRFQHFKGGDVPVPAVEDTRWDCRNEDPRSRGRYDIEVIEAALGMQERKGFGERFFERQWTGGILTRESTVLLVVMLVMAAVRPNLFPMEIAFSSILALELLLSLYFLRIDFIFSHYWRLTVRLFGVVVGYVPPALPYVALRGLRLVEGWSSLFVLPGMVRWGLLYSLISFVTVWMIAFVAALQFYETQKWRRTGSTTQPSSNATDGESSPIDLGICHSTPNCLAISLRELVIPAWTPNHIQPTREAPLMATMIVAFQLLFIPFVLTIALHPLLQLSNFIGRFLRLVVQSLHKDVLGYLDSYIEGEPWFFHWRVKIAIPPNITTKLKMWVYDAYRRNTLFDSAGSSRSSVSTSFVHPQTTFVDPFVDARRAAIESASPSDVLDEIICKGQFASFEENESRDDKANRLRWRRLRRLSRRPVLHYANMLMTFTSIAFLWVSDTTYSRKHAISILAVIFHLLSIVTSVIVFPKDITVALTFLGCASLLVSVVMVLLPGRAFHEYYCLRFISLIRLGQLQVFPFTRVKRFLKTFLYSGMKVAFPVVVSGALAYAAELLRAQIFLVTQALDFGNQTFDSNATDVWYPKNLSFPESLLLSRCSAHLLPPADGNQSTAVNDTYSVHCDRVRTPQLQETLDLFSYYFGTDAFIYYSIFSYWVLPAICVSSCLAYMFWSGANLLDTRRLTIQLIPLLEDPVTLAQFRPNIRYFRFVGNAVLLVSVVFGCVFSPTTTATSDDLRLFFGFEIGFTAVGLVESTLAVAFAVHRCGSTWVSWQYVDDSENNSFFVAGDCFLLFCEVVELLYYAIALPMCATLLIDRNDCFISPDDYATFFITLRFVFVLRLLPRQYILALVRDTFIFVFAIACVVVYFIGCTSALADLSAASKEERVSPSLWSSAFGDLIRFTFTSAAPPSFVNMWSPLNVTLIATDILGGGGGARYVRSEFISSRLMFILATIGKAVLSAAAGVGIAIALIPLRAHAVYPLPKKSALLYGTLSGGLVRILQYGNTNHDDMRPEARRKIQSRKFSRIFTEKGIPSWALPHLLEELEICRPARQRRFMFSLRQLLIFLPISEKRQSMVKEYMDTWDAYRNGAPSKLRFSSLPVFPPGIAGDEKKKRGRSAGEKAAKQANSASTTRSSSAVAPTKGHGGDMRMSLSQGIGEGSMSHGLYGDGTTGNPYAGFAFGGTYGQAIPMGREERAAVLPSSAAPLPHSQFIAPLRLVQALAFFELGFPSDSSMGSKIWMDFFSVVQKVRAATLLQSLWRMYRQERDFDADKSRTFQEKMTIAILRRSFRKYRVKSNVVFRSHETFGEAMLFDREAFNPGTGHYDLLNRLRGHYSALSPTTKFVLKEEVAPETLDGTGANTTNTVSQYVSRYLQQTSKRRLSISTSLSPTRGGVGGVGRDFFGADRTDENSVSMQSVQPRKGLAKTHDV